MDPAAYPAARTAIAMFAKKGSICTMGAASPVPVGAPVVLQVVTVQLALVQDGFTKTIAAEPSARLVTSTNATDAKTGSCYKTESVSLAQPPVPLAKTVLASSLVLQTATPVAPLQAVPPAELDTTSKTVFASFVTPGALNAQANTPAQAAYPLSSLPPTTVALQDAPAATTATALAATQDYSSTVEPALLATSPARPATQEHANAGLGTSYPTTDAFPAVPVAKPAQAVPPALPVQVPLPCPPPKTAVLPAARPATQANALAAKVDFSLTGPSATSATRPVQAATTTSVSVPMENSTRTTGASLAIPGAPLVLDQTPAPAVSLLSSLLKASAVLLGALPATPANALPAQLGTSTMGPIAMSVTPLAQAAWPISASVTQGFTCRVTGVYLVTPTVLPVAMPVPVQAVRIP